MTLSFRQQQQTVPSHGHLALNLLSLTTSLHIHILYLFTTMAAYLAEHVPHLQRLHLQLGLPPEALKSDEAAIEAAIKNAVTTLIRNREGEVDGWRDAIEDVRRSMVSVAKALGDKARDAVSAARRDSESTEVGLASIFYRLILVPPTTTREAAISARSACGSER